MVRCSSLSGVGLVVPQGAFAGTLERPCRGLTGYARGATLVGSFPTDGYTYEYSFAVRDGKFVGLPFDKINEADKTDERLERWVAVLQEEFLPA